MKVLHLIDTLGIGGAEQMLVNILPKLRDAGVSCEVGVMRPPYTLEPAFASCGLPVIRLPSPYKWNLIQGALTVARLAKESRADIVHAHLLFPSVYTGLARLMHMMRARSCVTWHNLAYAPGCNKPGPGLVIRRGLNALTSNFGMDGRIAVSTAVAEHYVAALGGPSPWVVPNPISVDYIDAAVAAQPAIARPRAVVIVLPGRMVLEKGHAVMVEALKQLSERGLDYQAIFVGDGPLRAPVERQIAAAGISNRVAITGLVAHDDLLRTLSDADIVVAPSIFEGFGMTAAEGMACGKPIVASRVGGLPDIIDDGITGVLVPPGNVGALAEALWRLGTDPDCRQRMGAAGRKRVMDRFAPSLVARQLVSFYQSLIDGPV